MRAMQFADAQKSRIDAAERKAMRRMIQAAPLPPQIKQALLQHSRSVQFSDDGREIPSVPLKWTTDAAVAVQFGYGPLELNRTVPNHLDIPHSHWSRALRTNDRLRSNAELDADGPAVQLPGFLSGDENDPQTWPERDAAGPGVWTEAHDRQAGHPLVSLMGRHLAAGTQPDFRNMDDDEWINIGQPSNNSTAMASARARQILAQN